MVETSLSKLQNRQKKAGTKIVESAKKPVAHSAELCYIGKEDERLINATRLMLSVNSELDLVDKSVIELMFLNGLRVSEVLSISSNDIMLNGMIKIKGLKGSNNRMVVSQLFNEFWQNSIRNGFVLKDVRSRYYYHRLFIKKGIYYKATATEKRIVTHTYRHLFIRLMNNNNIGLNEIKQLIGHKSITSTLHYHDKKKYRT